MASSKQNTARPENLLLESCMNIFPLVMPLVSGDRGASLGDDLRARLLAAFAELERIGFELQLDPNAVSDAKYALAAFVDEKVLSSAWPQKGQWMGKPLQLEFFGEHLAGEGFFQKLNKLRQGGERNVDVLEVYYVCLQLGFEGMYRLRGLEQLLALQVDLRSQVVDYRGRVARALSLHGVPNLGLIEKVQREVPYWVIGVVTVSVLFFGYLAFAVVLDRQVESARTRLQADRQRILAYAPQGYATPGRPEGTDQAMRDNGRPDAQGRHDRPRDGGTRDPQLGSDI